MRMKYYVLFFFVLFLCACTGDENSSSCSVSVQLLSPTDEVILPFEEMEVVLTNKDQGTVYTSSCSSGIWILYSCRTLSICFRNYFQWKIGIFIVIARTG